MITISDSNYSCAICALESIMQPCKACPIY